MTAPLIGAGDVVWAAFEPLDTRDLEPGAELMVGQRFRWEATHIIDDGYPYAGQWRMQLSEEDWRRTGMIWAPLCDLADVGRTA